MNFAYLRVSMGTQDVANQKFGIKYMFDQRLILGEYTGWFKLWHENGKLQQEFLGKELPSELKGIIQ